MRAQWKARIKARSCTLEPETRKVFQGHDKSGEDAVDIPAAAQLRVLFFVDSVFCGLEPQRSERFQEN